jgi:UDP-3-O-[3-hydroxymyristoyl] glucosamine N-acyltransferase
VTVVGLSAGDVARLTGGDLVGDPTARIAGVSSLERAGPGDLSFVARSQLVPAFERTQASAVLMLDTLREVDNGRTIRIFVPNPYRSLCDVIDRLHPRVVVPWGIHATASLGAGVSWSGRIAIGANSVVGSRTTFGEDCTVGESVCIGEGVKIGARARIDVNVSVAAGVHIGDDVVMQCGARIGTDGFGYARAGTGHDHVPHIGGCIIGSNVEIGANTTIDRGTMSDTVIGDGTKIDDLVQVAHNCRVGKNCLIMAQVGMAGSTIVEDNAVLAGQAGLAGHLTVGRDARVAAQAGVIGDVPPNATVSGYPARDHRDVLRQAAAGRRLTRHVRTLERIARKADGL